MNWTAPSTNFSRTSKQMNSVWTKATLAEFVKLQRGHDLPESRRRTGRVPVIGSAGVTGYHDTAKAKGPGVTIGRSGASFGVVNYSSVDYWPHNAALYVTDFQGNHERFAYYLLKSLDFKNFNSGSAQQSLNRNFIYPIPVHIPPLPIQCRIADILAAYDDLIENNTRRIAILEEMARRIYEEWFVHFRFPGHENFPLVESEMGLIPEGWKSVAVPEVIELDPKTHVPKEGLKPFVPMSSLSESSMLITNVEERTGNSGSKFKNNDVLLAKITPCLENGKTGFVNVLHSEDAVAFGSTEYIVLRSKIVTPEYVYLLARSDSFRNHAIKSMGGSDGRQRVRTEAFNEFRVVQPNKSTLGHFTHIAVPIFEVVKCLAHKNENLRRTRDLLLPKLISGEIDVSHFPDLTEHAYAASAVAG